MLFHWVQFVLRLCSGVRLVLLRRSLVLLLCRWGQWVHLQHHMLVHAHPFANPSPQLSDDELPCSSEILERVKAFEARHMQHVVDLCEGYHQRRDLFESTEAWAVTRVSHLAVWKSTSHIDQTPLAFTTEHCCASNMRSRPNDFLRYWFGCSAAWRREPFSRRTSWIFPFSALEDPYLPCASSSNTCSFPMTDAQVCFVGFKHTSRSSCCPKEWWQQRVMRLRFMQDCVVSKTATLTPRLPNKFSSSSLIKLNRQGNHTNCGRVDWLNATLHSYSESPLTSLRWCHRLCFTFRRLAGRSSNLVYWASRETWLEILMKVLLRDQLDTKGCDVACWWYFSSPYLF